MISYELLDLLDIVIKLSDKPVNKLSIAELGNQWTYNGSTGKNLLLNSYGVRKHVSFDINGEDGALPLDLGLPQTGFENKFDIVTNFGTSEHIFNQYEVFKNIHYFLKKNGLALHIAPPVGNWPKHGFYSYDDNFFDNLAAKCKYRVLFKEIREVIHGERHLLICTILEKLSENKFITEEVFNTVEGLYVE